MFADGYWNPINQSLSNDYVEAAPTITLMPVANLEASFPLPESLTLGEPLWEQRLVFVRVKSKGTAVTVHSSECMRKLKLLLTETVAEWLRVEYVSIHAQLRQHVAEFEHRQLRTTKPRLERLFARREQPGHAEALAAFTLQLWRLYKDIESAETRILAEIGLKATSEPVPRPVDLT